MIVVLGANGTLGREFVRVLGNKCVGLSRADFDFLEETKLESRLQEINPSIIINCAAVVSLARVSEYPNYSFKVNALLAQRLALYCASSEKKTKLLHISTDHFFNSDNLFAKHSEEHPVTLYNDYASQKYVAEQLILSSLPSALVVRTSLLGIRNMDGTTLVEWMLKTLKYEKEIIGYFDAVTSAIPATILVELAIAGLDKNLKGLYNIGSVEPYTKLDLVREVVAFLDLKNISVVAKAQPHTQLLRAKSCGLDSARFSEAVGSPLPSFPEFLTEMALDEIYEKI